jgi:hypothetical protein
LKRKAVDSKNNPILIEGNRVEMAQGNEHEVTGDN